MKNGINKISAYGDSILKGAVTGTDSGHLFDIIEDSSLVLASKALGFELNNQSVFGSIVSKTQRRLNRDIEKGIFSDLAIIESGGNDCDYDWTQVSSSPDEKHLPRTTLEDFIQKISEMVDVCRKNKITPLTKTRPAKRNTANGISLLRIFRQSQTASITILRTSSSISPIWLTVLNMIRCRINSRAVATPISRTSMLLPRQIRRQAYLALRRLSKR